MAENATKKKADEERARRVQEEKERLARERIEQTPIVGRADTPHVDTADPVEAAKQDPRIGPQDIPPEERTDGVTAGIRHDQMQGVQSAAQINDLDEEEILAEQLENPTNLTAASEATVAARTVMLEDEGRLPPRTQEEMKRGKEAISRFDGATTRETRSTRTRTEAHTETAAERKAREEAEAKAKADADAKAKAGAKK